jgi:guanine deaminase
MSAGLDPERDARLLRRCIEQAERRMRAGHGGPFAALVARGEEIVAEGWNEVTSTNDPTAHAEVQAIRAACRTLGSWQLAGCTLYASCEPCPMCLGAAYWARPDGICYAATRADAARAGFDDALIYDELARAPGDRRLPFRHVALPEAARPFEGWAALPDRLRY